MFHKRIPRAETSKFLFEHIKQETIKKEHIPCRGPAPVDPGTSKVGTVSVSLEITYLIQIERD